MALGSGWLGLKKATHAQETSATSTGDATTGDATTISGKNTHDRDWLGSEIWADPMEDWRVLDGAAECQTSGGDRSLHLITHQLTDAAGSMAMPAVVRHVEVGKKKNRYEKAHQKGSGFGLVTIDTVAKTYSLESFRFLIDATDGSHRTSFPVGR